MSTMPVAGPATRHPLDPDPVRSTKSRAVFTLGLLALLTGPFVGGVVPATVAMLLARQARREAYESGGFLTGAALLRRGERMAWAGLVLAATTLVIALVIGLVSLADGAIGRDFAPGVD